MSYDHLFFNLESFKVERHSNSPELCWLLIRNPQKLNELPLRRAFMVSIDQTTGHDQAESLLNEGHATSFKEAFIFFADVIAGKLSLEATRVAFRHLTHVAGLPKTMQLERERAVFANQFNSPTPEMGLRGFLEKKTAKFTHEPKTIQELQELVQWLKGEW